MSKILTAAAIAASYEARHPAQAGIIENLAASGDTVAGLQAAAVRPYAVPTGKLVYVKALEHFYVAGELVQIGDYVQVSEKESRGLVNIGRAEIATDEDVAAASQAKK